MPISIEEIKKRFSNLTDEDKKENISKIVSFDYVLENTDGSFQTTSLNINKSVQQTIIKQIKNKIDGYSKASLIDFDFTKELGKNQIGAMGISAYLAYLNFSLVLGHHLLDLGICPGFPDMPALV